MTMINGSWHSEDEIIMPLPSFGEVTSRHLREVTISDASSFYSPLQAMGPFRPMRWTGKESSFETYRIKIGVLYTTVLFWVGWMVDSING